MALIEPEGLSRREVMAGLSVALTGLPRWIEAMLDLAASGPPPLERKAHDVLDSDQYKALEQLCDLLLPRTDTPGALDAGVPAFIVRFLEHLDDPVSAHFREGLVALDEHCHKTEKVALAAASPVALGVSTTASASDSSSILLSSGSP